MSDLTTDRLVFVNLPVRDLEASVAFFTALGFRFNEKFSDQTTACMIVSDQAYFMLLQTERFESFAKKPIGDATTTTPAMYALSAPDRAGVDAFADAALAAGGSEANDAIDHGFMYGRSFYDLDGHHWEVMWMDQAAVEAGPAEFETAA